MQPQITDKFGKASISTNYAVATTVKTARTSGESVLACYDLSKFAPDTPVFFVTYKKSTDPTTNEVLITNQISWKALVNPDNNTLTNLTLAPGYVDSGNAQGDFVECIPTSYWGNSVVEGLLSSHNGDGSLKTDAVNAALGITGVTPPDWTAIPQVPAVIANNGQKEHVIKYAGVDLTSTLNEGMKLRIPRTGVTPTTSMSFTAANSQYATRAAATGINQTDDITVEGNFRVESYASNFQYLVCARNGSLAGWFLAINTQGQVTIYGGNGSAEDFATSYQSVPLNKWVHIAASIDVSASTAKIYIDGVDVPLLYTNSAATSFTAPNNIRLGANQVGGETLNGKIANARLWSTIRTVAQIRDNMNQEVPASTTGLVGHWKGNGSWNDSSANANHLTSVNGAVNNFASHPFSAIEYAIATKVVKNGADTDVTIFTGSGALPNATLGATSYSTADTPYGFSADKNKWSITIPFTSDISHGLSQPFIWEALNSVLFVLPTGAWKNPTLNAVLRVDTNPATSIEVRYLFMSTIPSTTLSMAIKNPSAFWAASAPASTYDIRRVELNAGADLSPIYHSSQTTYRAYWFGSNLSSTRTLTLCAGTGGMSFATAECAYL